MSDIAANGGAVFADKWGGRTEAAYAAPEIGEDNRSAGQPSVWQPVSLKAVVWAPPVFIVGCPRSGTTLVQTILDSHPGLSVLYEANFLIDIPLGLQSGQANASDALTLAQAHPNFQAYGFDERRARLACMELGITDSAGAMRALAASLAFTQGKRRWGNKTPKALLHLPELAILYPDAQFVHVIRDGRNSAESPARVDRSLVQNALLWRTGMRIGRRAGSSLGIDRYLELRLEDLLFFPKNSSAGFAPSSERTSTSHCSTSTRPPGTGSQSRTSRHPRLGQPPLPPAATVRQLGSCSGPPPHLSMLNSWSSGTLQLPHRRGNRIFHVSIGYAFFLVSLRRSLRELFRHFARSVGARRATRRVRLQSVDGKFEGGTLPRRTARPLLPARWTEP